MTEALRIVIGSDDAGFDYKEILKRDLELADGVASVVDVGVDAEGHTPYPRVAVAAAGRSTARRGRSRRGDLIGSELRSSGAGQGPFHRRR